MNLIWPIYPEEKKRHLAGQGLRVRWYRLVDRLEEVGDVPTPGWLNVIVLGLALAAVLALAVRLAIAVAW